MVRSSALAMLMALIIAGTISIVAGTTRPVHRHIPDSVVAPKGVLPSIVHHTSPQARKAYRAALHAPDVLSAVPCTCGCLETLGHINNFECYVEGVNSDGSVGYSTHGLYCYTCQVITFDALAGAEAGMNDEQLHEMIVDRYGGG